MLLDAWAIPVCIFFCWLYMRPKYHWTQLLVSYPSAADLHDVALITGLQGIVICVGGLGMLVASDELTDKDWPALSRAKGDVFMLVGATLYGFSTSTYTLPSMHQSDTISPQPTRRRSSSSVARRCTRSSASSVCGERSLTVSKPPASSTTT